MRNKLEETTRINFTISRVKDNYLKEIAKEIGASKGAVIRLAIDLLIQSISKEKEIKND